MAAGDPLKDQEKPQEHLLMGMVRWKEGIDEAGDGGENKSRSA